jgi:hypothetical protein
LASSVLFKLEGLHSLSATALARGHIRDSNKIINKNIIEKNENYILPILVPSTYSFKVAKFLNKEKN